MLLFIITSFIVIITPGQDMLLVMSRSLSRGSKAGVATAAGVSTGLLGHTIFAACGLGALLQASQKLFVIVKFIGAAYLLYLGFKLIFTKQNDLEFQSGKPSSLRKLYLQGAVSNISNPKIVIFFLSYLPQFVVQSEKGVTLQLVLLGVTFALLTFLIKGFIGYMAGCLARWIKSNKLFLLWLNRVSGLFLVGLGLKLAFERKK